MKFFLSFLIVIITLISVLNTKCVPISDYILSSGYLNNLEADKEISLISKKSIYEVSNHKLNQHFLKEKLALNLRNYLLY